MGVAGLVLMERDKMRMRRLNITTLVVWGVVLSAGTAWGEMIDLTAAGSQGNVGGARFYQYDPEGSTGSGRIDSFLRIQGSGSGGFESGYNTGGTLEYDTKDADVLRLWDIPLVQVDGVSYYEFLLDVNEPGGNKSLISLDELRIHVAALPDLDDSQLGTPVFDLDSGGNRSIILDAGLVGSGSGDGDMLMLIRSDLMGADTSRYVYLYSGFGGVKAADGRVEEWAGGT